MPLLAALIPLLPQALPAALTMAAEMFRFLSTEQGQRVVSDMLADKERTRKFFEDIGERLKSIAEKSE